MKSNKNKPKIISKVLFTIETVCLIVTFLFAYHYYEYKQENKRLINLNKEYKTLIEDKELYTNLKDNYLLELEKEKNIDNDNNILEEKINTLNNEIKKLEEEILNLDKKIKSVS
jgi:hypothetical protein